MRSLHATHINYQRSRLLCAFIYFSCSVDVGGCYSAAAGLGVSGRRVRFSHGLARLLSRENSSPAHVNCVLRVFLDLLVLFLKHGLVNGQE